MKPSQKYIYAVDKLSTANELNAFYRKFDKYNFTAEHDIILFDVVPQEWDRIYFDHVTVNKVFKQVSVNKATGPDDISLFLLKTFADELTQAWRPIFQRSVDTHTVPSLWKRATTTPLAKKKMLVTGEQRF